jgi:biopolymer transport protein ExbB/TolQ
VEKVISINLGYMDNIWSILLDKGLSLALLGIAIWYLSKEKTLLQNEIKILLERLDKVQEARTQERLQLITLSEKMQHSLEQNTEAIDSLRKIIDDRNKVATNRKTG